MKTPTHAIAGWFLARCLKTSPDGTRAIVLGSVAPDGPVVAAAAGFFHLFVLGAASHAVIDILTHVDDAPLLLWPFSLDVRWPGPVSHWDSRHFGHLITVLEVCLWSWPCKNV